MGRKKIKLDKLPYAEYNIHNGIIYSVDRIHISVAISDYNRERLMKTIGISTEDRECNVYRKTGARQFKYMYTLKYKSGDSMVIQLYHNSARYENRDRGYIEFNPNKICRNDAFRDDLKTMKTFMHFLEIKRFDLAIDIPQPRENIVMAKTDNRQYSCQKKSHSDFSEYLGVRNSVSRVKLYNKTQESNLSYELTRLEVTCSPDKIRIPDVYDRGDLTQKECLVRDLVLTNDNFTVALSRVSKYHRADIKRILEKSRIEISEECVDAMREYALSFLGGSKADDMIIA